VVVVHARGADVAAHEHGVHAEPPHQAELRLGAAHVAGERRGVHPLGVPERLEEVQRDAEAVRQGADLLRALRRRDEVRLEHLDAVEAGGRTGLHLLGEGAAEADGGDRRTHAGLLSNELNSTYVGAA
jgi:hypothetical protein